MVWVPLLAENRILEAFEKGEFENLPGKGAPLNLSDYFNMPVTDRMAFSLLKSAGILPPDLQLLKEAEELEHALKKSNDPNQGAQLRHQIQARRVSFAMSAERRRSAARTDSGLEPGTF